MGNVTSRISLVRMFDQIPVYDQLRGGTTLQTLAKESVYGSVLDLIEPVGERIVIPLSGVIFCDLSRAMGPYGHGTADELLRGPSLMGKLPLILDVHFPFWNVDSIVGLQHGDEVARDDDGTHDLREFWSKKESVEKAIELVQHADVVTASQLPWARHLVELNPRTTHLPDVHNPVEGLIFTRTLIPLMVKAFRNRYLSAYPDQISWIDRLRIRLDSPLLLWTYRFTAQGHHRKELERLEWKFRD